MNITRALLCEIIANRLLRRYSEDNPGPEGLLLVANILVRGFDPFQNAPKEVIEENVQVLRWMQKRAGQERRIPALEVAIISESKTFLSSMACQNVVTAIYEGRVVYTPSSFIDILPDHYKQKPISLYDPRGAPLLNQYRLIVPRTRNILEVCQFIVLLLLYVSVMTNRDPSKVTGEEVVFIIYALGWILDQFASILEHGWGVYTQNLWSFLDVTFATIYGVYLVLRLHGVRTGDLESGQQALDWLAIGAPVLIPRLAFNLMSENMLFVSLRSMMADFTILTGLAVWCFAGFLLAMTWLSDGQHQPITIGKWMLWVWFGLDGTGIQRSVEFHWLLGPMLMVAFAFLGNTLFLTILVSMLSSTFAAIAANAHAEIQFRRAVLTLEGVKSDAIFAYQPPLNILALVVLTPLKFLVSPRWFHKINVAAVRTVNAPLLLIIGLLERRSLWTSGVYRTNLPPGFRSTGSGMAIFSRAFSVHGDIQSVFASEPPQAIMESITATNDLSQNSIEEAYRTGGKGKNLPTMPPFQRQKSRKDSVAPFEDLTQHLRKLLNESGGVSDDVDDRLEALEDSTLRIESMLTKLCKSLDQSQAAQDEVREEGSVGTGKIGDLDKSLNEDPRYVDPKW